MGSRSSPNRLTVSPKPPPPDRPGRHQNLAIALGLVPRYPNGGFAENHNMYIRRQPCVGLQTACHTELSTRCAHLLMMRSFVLSQSIVQNPGDCAEATT